MLTIHQKSVVATVLMALALAQLGAISVARGWIGSVPMATRRRLTVFHRMEGYVGLALILWIAYNCVFYAMPRLHPLRVAIHTLTGPLVIAVILAKVAIGRFFPRQLVRMPTLGVLLFCLLTLQWLLSAVWFFLQYYAGVLRTY